MSKPRSGAPRRVAVGLLAGALAVFGIALAPQAGATSSVSTERLAGTTRYGTAQAIAVHASMGTPTGAIVATGENFPDALAASTFAGANGPRPIVLTETNNYTAEAKAALAALKVKLATLPVTIVGGTSAVSADVEASIKADGFTVTRQAGATRYETAAAIATAANTAQTGGSGLIGGQKTAIFATGENFPDALAGGPMAYRNDLPLLLVTATSVPQATQDAISTLKIVNVIILGGTTAISNDVQTQLTTLTTDATPTRLAGSNRNATAAAIGDYEIGTLAFPATSAVLATGLNFPDALAAGVFAGVQGAPIVLTSSLPAESTAFLDKYSYLITKLWASGGTSAVDDATVTAAQTAAQTVSNDTSATDAPELLRVEAAGTDTGGGQIWRYVFDEAIQTSTTFGNFVAYTAYGERVAATAATRDSANTSAALALFALGDSTKLNESSVFATAASAVQDVDGNFNPEADVAGPASRTFAAGITRGPDLTSVAVVVADTQFDFTFDSAVTAVTATSFRMVDTNSNNVGTIQRTSTAAAIQTGSLVVRVTFAAGTGTGVRGVALAGAVTGSTSSGQTASNVKQAADVTGSTAVSNAPDLVSVTLDAANSRVTYTFDEAVETLGTAGSRVTFHVYYRQGTVLNTSTLATDKSSTDSRSIIAQFPAGSINDSVAGAIVDAGSVARVGFGPTVLNSDEREGVAKTFTAGTYIGPNLTTAARTSSTSFGGVTTVTVAYTFDKAVGTLVAANFAVVSVAGVRVTFGTLTGGACALATGSTTVVNCTVTDATARGTVNAARSAVVAQGAVIGTTVYDVAGNQTAVAPGTITTISNHEERNAI